MRIALIFLVVGMAGCAAGPGSEHAHHGPYAGQQFRPIKALSDEETKGYLEGAGMGFAKAAELNGYPGPSHVIEQADALALTPAQRADVAKILERHKSEVRILGADVVRLEKELDELFTSGQASAATIEAKTAEVGTAQAKVRASHLRAHVLTTALLTEEQRAKYNQLRGY